MLPYYYVSKTTFRKNVKLDFFFPQSFITPEIVKRRNYRIIFFSIRLKTRGLKKRDFQSWTSLALSQKINPEISLILSIFSIKIYQLYPQVKTHRSRVSSFRSFLLSISRLCCGINRSNNSQQLAAMQHREWIFLPESSENFTNWSPRVRVCLSCWWIVSEGNEVVRCWLYANFK